jgi:hypothetical protein
MESIMKEVFLETKNREKGFSSFKTVPSIKEISKMTKYKVNKYVN